MLGKSSLISRFAKDVFVGDLSTELSMRRQGIDFVSLFLYFMNWYLLLLVLISLIFNLQLKAVHTVTIASKVVKLQIVRRSTLCFCFLYNGVTRVLNNTSKFIIVLSLTLSVLWFLYSIVWIVMWLCVRKKKNCENFVHVIYVSRFVFFVVCVHTLTPRLEFFFIYGRSRILT